MTRETVDVKSIFAKAIDIPSPAEREAYLTAACADHPDLLGEVQELLRAFAKAGSFMEGDADQAETVELGIQERPGAVIGPYKLLQEIGEGGFGVVYMAEQERPVRRKVALKIIKPGMDTKEVIARFEAERQALALMEHPNIAHVLDAGATESGRPYFVMELVKGIPLADYCDEGKLGTRERLELFKDVCQAVHHAHQRGIIHRDIKPANILVTLHDGKPVVKVIDFGVAKATNQKLTERTLFTSFGQMVGTPLYMSPEQAAFSGLDVDTRTDIYSLGVVLYELLTGSTPFDRERLHSAGFDEVRRIIREEDPPKPSTKISTLGAMATTISSHRHSDPRKLSALIRGDLDWIVMKALEKDRNRRYDTAKDFAEDIERHLTHQPVKASPPSVVYRTRKFIRRNRAALQVCAVILVLCGIMGGVFVRNEMQEQREIARQEVREELPEIRSLIAAEDYVSAWKRLGEAEELIPRDPMLLELWDDSTVRVTVRTEPSGAQVEFKPWNAIDSEWVSLGQAPLRHVRIPRGPLRWRFTKAGFSTSERLNTLQDEGEFVLALTSESNGYQGMVHVSSPDEPFDFYIDKYEVTNRQYASFVRVGGYQNLKYWQDLFETVRAEGKSEDEAKAILATFLDKTNLPGPAGWSNGTFPPGEDDHPVTGVSWYEAAAYARYVEKELPTISHWEFAASGKDAGWIIPLSNFSDEGVVPVGTYPGTGYHGLFDMAGNAKEWCWNAGSDGTRFLLGGAHYEPTYMFTNRDRFLPLTRSASVGFRCVSYEAPPTGQQIAVISIGRSLCEFTPLTDEELATTRKIFAYNSKAPLNEETASVDDSHDDYTHQIVHVDAAYGGERLILHLFLPKGAAPPYQTILFFPGAGAKKVERHVDALSTTDLKRPLPFVKLGRAACFPIYSGTYERISDAIQSTHPAQERECQVRLAQDVGRAVDYLASNPETFDLQSLAYMGSSWGACLGPLMTVVDGRFKGCVLLAGGLSIRGQREISPACYAAHMDVPVLMLNGNQDATFPVETSQKPLFEAIGVEQKDHRLFDAGHGLPISVTVAQASPWLDGLFGRPLEIQIPPAATAQDLERYEKRAQSCLDSKLLDAAEIRIANLLEHRRMHLGNEHRDTLRTKGLQARLRKLQKRPDEAMALYEETLEDQRAHLGFEDPETQKTVRELAGIYTSQAWSLSIPTNNSLEDYEKGHELAERSLELDPKGDYRRWMAAWARYRVNDLAGALEMLHECAKYDEYWPGQHLTFAVVHKKLGNHHQARDWYTAARAWIEADRVTKDFILQLQEEAEAVLGETAAGCRLTKDAYTRIFANCPPGRLTSNLHERLNDPESAEADMTEALKSWPDSIACRVRRVTLRVKLNRWPGVEEDLSKLAKLEPENHWHWFKLAPLRLYLNDQEGYEEACKIMLDLAKESIDPIVGERAAKVCCLQPVVEDRRQLLCELAEKALRARPEGAWWLLGAGLAKYRSGDYADATGHLSKALVQSGGKSPPADAMAYLFLSMIEHERQNAADAVSHLRKAKALIYTQCPFIGRGQSTGNWHDWKMASFVLEEASELVESTPREETRAGLEKMIETPLARPAEEADVYTEALQNDPDNTQIVRFRGYSLGRHGCWSEAVRDFYAVAQTRPTDSIYALTTAYLLRRTDLVAYLQFSRDMRARFGNPAKSSEFARALRASLLHPDSATDWKRFARSAEQNLLRYRDNEPHRYIRVMAGLACYRAGRLDDAIPHLEWAKDVLYHDAPSANALVVLAMVAHSQNRAEEAHDYLQMAQQAREISQEVSIGDTDWSRWLLHDILRDEAVETLGISSNQPPDQKSEMVR